MASTQMARGLCYRQPYVADGAIRRYADRYEGRTRRPNWAERDAGLMALEAWLAAHGLSAHAARFREHAIDLDVLADLSEAELAEIGVPLGDRKRLIKALAANANKDLQGAAGPATSPRPPAAEPTPEAQRRWVAVVFIDLCGFTALNAEWEEDDVHALLDRFFAVVDRLVLAHGGIVDKHIGDCVMAVFGARDARGDDAERAVRTAVAAVDAMPALSVELGRDLAIHAGIAAGSVIASHTGSSEYGEFTVTGDAVNLASRLTERAGASEVVVSAPVAEALRHVARMEPLTAVALKGFREPQAAFRIISLLEAATFHVGSAPLLGRDQELCRATTLLDIASSQALGQLLVLRGEAGIGKSRLLAELVLIAAGRGCRSHLIRVLDFGTATGRDPARMLARSLAADLADGDVESGGVIAGLARDLGLNPSQRLHLFDLLNQTAPPELAALQDALQNADRLAGRRETLIRLAREAAAAAPRLLAFEDVHWADPVSLGNLAALGAALAAEPILIVVTGRPEGGWMETPHLATEIATTTLELGPLRPEDAHALARRRASGDPLFVERCVARAGGNPLFLEELLRSANRDDDGSVPSTLQSLVQARLDGLEEGAKLRLQEAAVLGQEVPVDAWQAVAGLTTIDDQDLAVSGMIEPGDGVWRFRHALVRDAIYATLVRQRRWDLHRRAAAYFSGFDLGLTAEHLARANDPEAAAMFGRAAQQEIERYRYERALVLVERGLATSADAAAETALGLLRGEVLVQLARSDEAIAAFRTLLPGLTEPGDRCRAWLGIASCLRLRSDQEAGLEVVAAATAENCGNHDIRSRIQWLKGNFLFASGDVAGCKEAHRAALAEGEIAGNPLRIAEAMSGLGDASYAEGSMRQAADWFTRCREICRAEGFGRVEVGSTHMLGNAYRYLQGGHAGLPLLEEAIDLAQQVGNTRTELVANIIKGEILADLGEEQTAEERFADALRLARRLQNRRYEAYAICELARLSANAGERAMAQRYCADGLALSEAVGHRFIGPRLFAIAARLETNSAAAHGHLEAGMATLAQGCIIHNALWFHRDAITVWLGLGDPDGVRRHADLLEACSAEPASPWTRYFAERGRALAVKDAERLMNLQSEAERLGLLVG